MRIEEGIIKVQKNVIHIKSLTSQIISTWYRNTIKLANENKDLTVKVAAREQLDLYKEYQNRVKIPNSKGKLIKVNSIKLTNVINQRNE